MPTRMLKTCSYPGCSSLAEGGARCAKHRSTYQRDRNRQRLYDRRWQRIRKVHLAEHPWCARCLAQGIYREAAEVHHKERHEGDRKKFYEGPFDSLCKPCHSSETAKEVGLSNQSPPPEKV